LDKRDKRIDLSFKYKEALKHNEELRKTYPDSKGYIWRTQRDERVRALHEILEGEYCEWDDPPIIGIDTGGIEVHGHPGEAWNCRCWAQIIEEPVAPVKSQQQQPIRQEILRQLESMHVHENPAQYTKTEKIIQEIPKIPVTKTKHYKEQIAKYVRIIVKALKSSKTKLTNIPKAIYSSIVWSKRR
jgi:uncharacterized protein with gpF-like domain